MINMVKFGRQGEVHAILSGTKVLTNSKVDEDRLLKNDINIYIIFHNYDIILLD